MLFGKRHHMACRGCHTKTTALEFEAEVKEKYSLIHRGKLPEEITIEQMFKEYKLYSKTNNATKTYTDNCHKVDVMQKFFGADTLIFDLKPLHIEKFKNYLLEQGKSKSTFNRYFSTLQKAFNLVIINNNLQMLNPCKQVGKLSEDNHIIRYLTEDEEQRLMQELPKYLKPIVICALTTGLRLSNCLNLRWESINFEYNFIEILKQENKGHKKIQLPLSQKFKTELEKIGIKKEGYVFVSHRTKSHYTKIHNGFTEALKRANIKNFRFHDLRHTVATRLVMNGADLMTVKEVMAHSSLATTQRYMHPTPENMKKAIDILDRF